MSDSRLTQNDALVLAREAACRAGSAARALVAMFSPERTDQLSANDPKVRKLIADAHHAAETFAKITSSIEREEHRHRRLHSTEVNP